MSKVDATALAQAFVTACYDELQAPKPGNVHVFSGGHRMTAQDFMDSAVVAAGPLTEAGLSVGSRILGAVEATFARVGQNTNLGIILLCAPIAHAALAEGPGDLRARVAATLAALDREDAELAFEAIRIANPAGLGAAPRHDVTGPAHVTLRAAMQAAAERDRIALQYSSDFKDLFNIGLPRLEAARARGADKALSTLYVYVGFLTAFPDTHVVRKFGLSAGEKLVEEARAFAAETDLFERDDAFTQALRFDEELKSRGLNPGTSADLTVATLFADYAGAVLANVHKNG
ncbi:MAG TPA: triphosphoribosyl-dephospho-CoA synthase [Methylocystis sp.]|nr:triphosphoribosyl-dephospho-CoA synthase [Methylocystis sp.]